LSSLNAGILRLQAFICQQINAPQFNAFNAYEFFAHFVYLADLAAQDYHLKAIVMVKMNVQRRNGFQDMRMLKLGQPFHNRGCVMVIHQDNRGDRLGLIIP
jgi:hypothetical protein